MTQGPQDLIGPLYLGAKEDVIPPFLRPSFDGERPRRSAAPPVLLSSNFAQAYAQGTYEEDGSVLEVWLHKGTRWRYRPTPFEFGCGEPPIAPPAGERRGLDCIRLGAGELWYVWDPAVVTLVRRLRHSEAIPLLCAAFDEAGAGATYKEGVVADYASIWWDRAHENPRLSVLKYRQRLEAVLRRHMGRKRAQAYLHGELLTAGHGAP
ncbi:hypothetical protein DelCs14_1619 [Delftia sp. Cs1-4]|uniref:hypothetical protein n=1 Tax=Delftia sp. (strain Cs1-4) TaxID=742013 RepID=UPI00020E7D13|nr:hypothetical protein [Delftia sp. Cs1-4]AEF88651.1 hypothetical protein DelCs14_1619 [Delftia sp. Cs1-4]